MGYGIAYRLVPVRHLADGYRYAKAGQRRLRLLDFRGQVLCVYSPVVQGLGSELNSTGHELRLCVRLQDIEECVSATLIDVCAVEPELEKLLLIRPSDSNQCHLPRSMHERQYQRTRRHR